jgi:hypothetical protein
MIMLNLLLRLIEFVSMSSTHSIAAAIEVRILCRKELSTSCHHNWCRPSKWFSREEFKAMADTDRLTKKAR